MMNDIDRNEELEFKRLCFKYGRQAANIIVALEDRVEKLESQLNNCGGIDQMERIGYEYWWPESSRCKRLCREDYLRSAASRDLIYRPVFAYKREEKL